MNNSDFESRFTKRRKTIKYFFIFNLVMMTAIICVAIYFASKFLDNPEAIGSFFGKIAKGFDGSR